MTEPLNDVEEHVVEAAIQLRSISSKLVYRPVDIASALLIATAYNLCENTLNSVTKEEAVATITEELCDYIDQLWDTPLMVQGRARGETRQ